MKSHQLKTNPFVFGKIVKGNRFVNRKDEREELATEIEQHTNVILFAPRRYGKTSLILQTFEDIKKKYKNFAGLVIDFYAVNSKEKFMIRLTNEYGRNAGFSFEKLIGILKQVLKGVSPSITIDQYGNPKVDIQITPSHFEAISENVLNLPRKLADSGKLVAVFFDEFQEINILNGQNFQKELRSIIQHHDNVSYIFSGSKFHLFETIFNKRTSPLYNIGKVKHLHKIPEEEYIKFISSNLRKIHPRFNSKMASQIFRLSGGIPYYVQMLAHETFNIAHLNPQEDPEKIIASANENIIANKSEEFLFIYENLSLSSKIVLEIVIRYNGIGLFKKEIQAQYQIAHSTLKKALNTLINKGVLNKQNAGYTFQDSFFKQWLEERQ